MCTPSPAWWTPIVTFLAGAVIALFAEPLRKWIFRTAIKVSFEPKTCDLKTNTTIEIPGALGPTYKSEGRWVRVRVETTRNRLAKGCRAYLVKVEVEENGKFCPSNFIDPLRLKWSSLPGDEVTKPLDIPKDVSQFVDVLSTDQHSPNRYVAQTMLMPNYCSHLFDERPKTLRLTITVTSDDAKPTKTRIIFRWKGTWDMFEVSSG
jgi:hypothetical protein